MLKMYLNTKYFLQMYLNTKYIDVFKYFCKYFFNFENERILDIKLVQLYSMSII